MLKQIKKFIKSKNLMYLTACIPLYFFRIIINSKKILTDIIYSISYYKELRIPYTNHLTIGIKKLALANTTFPHPVGIVIGKGVVIGNGCQIYQNVTIGLKKESETKYPRIGNNVTIYANSIVIGDIEIGDNSIIGAGTIVSQNVPPNSIVFGNPGKIINNKRE